MRECGLYGIILSKQQIIIPTIAMILRLIIIRHLIYSFKPNSIKKVLKTKAIMIPIAKNNGADTPKIPRLFIYFGEIYRR